MVNEPVIRSFKDTSMPPKDAKSNSNASATDDHAADVQRYLDTMLSRDTYDGWGANLSKEGLKLISWSSSPVGQTIFEYEVNKAHTNGLGNLHGGCCATIFDFCTSTALVPIAKPGFWTFVGVSRTLNVTYIRPMPVGEVVIVECEVVHAGKRLAALKGVMKRKSDGAIMAHCEHGKVNVDHLGPSL